MTRRSSEPRRLAGLRAFVLAAAGVAICGLAAPALADAATLSDNWAGYAAHGTRFGRVAGSWTVPRGNCSPGSPSYSATWVGLGGFSSRSQALEQTGTELDCHSSGGASYFAWYELVPAAAHEIRVRVHAGDRIAASVEVRGRRVSLKLRNRTTGARFALTQSMSAPDVSSADWIVEAPSACSSRGRCAVLPLGDFGAINFAGGAATSAKGHAGTISDPAWSASPLQLLQAAGGAPGFANASSFIAAVPSALSAGGTTFSVTYGRQGVAPPQPPATFPGFARRGA